MAYKIYLDAGHGGVEPGAIHEGRMEKDDNLDLTLAVGNILQQNGIDVNYTRTTDVYHSPVEKATIANNGGADFFVSIHRNAMEVPNTGSGVETLVYDKTGIKTEMAKNINAELVKLGFTDLGVDARPDLVVLRETGMPSILIEAGFINSDIDNALFDAKFPEIAQGIANGILKTLAEAEKEKVTYYRVQVGMFSQRPNADVLFNELNNRGFPVFIVYEDGYFKVQVGAFTYLQNAIQMEKRLRDSGYHTFITT